ncbi:MAG: outer membrane protein assembly factor BamB [Magnetococcales bacterium]|nr:outer membrane protein assembly factor BamB [Magnetococcales bacterium]
MSRLAAPSPAAPRRMLPLAALLLLSVSLTPLGGCGWFGGPSEADQVASAVDPFHEPQPGTATGLNRAWKSNVASEPSHRMEHPGVIAVDKGDVYVASHQGAVTRIDRQTGSRAWNVEIGRGIEGGVAVDGELVFAGTTDGQLVALKKEDGSVAWRAPLTTVATSAPAAAAGRVIVVSLDNRAHCFDARTGKRLWSHAATPEALVLMGAGAPTVVGSAVLVGYSTGEVFALALEDGRRLWSDNLTTLSASRSELDMLQDVDARIVVDGKRAYAVNHQGRLTAFNVNGGRIWERPLSALRTPLILGDRIIAADTEGNLQAVSAADGTPLWKVRLTSGLLAAPVEWNGKIVAADDEGRLYTVSPRDGKVVGLDKIKETVFADPIVADKALYLWTNEGNLHRYD